MKNNGDSIIKNMQTKIYTGQIWEQSTSLIYPSELLGLLESKDTLVILKNGEPPFRVVIGVPHQAAIGESVIAENWTNQHGRKGRDSDENAASFALVTFSKLCEQSIPCKIVIATHATDHDPNKDTNSAYCEEVFSEETNLLFECHGAGDKRKQDIEISAGANTFSNALDFGRRLASQLNYHYSLSAQIEASSKNAKSICRENEADTTLTLPALETTSLIQAGKRKVAALHLEAKPCFRIPENDHSVSGEGLVLGNAIAEVILSKVDL
ncbi:hypothetical protein [Leptolinea tardivitalis]|uniref:Uncharacterized protein n=1 Tax=Leptolinea tardivitalis TaxID=229920 RepID=A0A0N8GKP9_9CHLR|nr:hypothetical protein [Leptolinea tardivitalis]KPL70306.1 hypothetical protein ADM99_14195 [Leptolinea tardivitalis]GAP21867.1 hypothetical protein LTAR_02085 [Leptolinea tardivitalis]